MEWRNSQTQRVRETRMWTRIQEALRVDTRTCWRRSNRYGEVGFWHPTIEKTFWFQASVVYFGTFTPRRWRRTIRAHSLLEERTMEVGIEFVLYMVGMARLLVVFLQFRKSRKRQPKSWERTGRPVVFSTLAKTSEDGFQEFNLFCYR